MSRKKSREYVFRMVFEQFFHDSDEMFEFLSEDIVLDETDKQFVNSLVGGINIHYGAIIDILKQNMVGYEIERVFKVDLAILVVAIYELKFSEDKVDSAIIINEAIELSKKYSTDKSYSFINGILAKVVKQ